MGTMFAAARSGPKLQVLSAAKVYNTHSGDLFAIDGCSLDIGAEEIVSIVGPSGCGKTTLLWSMSGLHRLTAGEILLDGDRCADRIRRLGWCSRTPTYCPWRNVDANIRFPFEIKGTKPDRAWIAELLTRVGLDGFGGRFPRELSGGMQQRAALVRALSFKPSVLLMDEPFGALDAFTREEMNHLVEEIWISTPRRRSSLITHSIEEAIFLSDRDRGHERAPGPGGQHSYGAVSAAALDGDHGDEGCVRPSNRIKIEIVGDRQRQGKSAEKAKASAVEP